MKLRGIEFGNVLGASGVQGFFGEGYWFHRLLRPFGCDLTSMTFVAKTTTLLSREGFMPLTRRYAPRSLFPRCIRVRLFSGTMLNAVGLSGPGIGALLGTGRWQKLTKPFWLSIMSLASTPQKRLEELRIMVDMIGFCLGDFSAPLGLQINLSCPNVGHDTCGLIDESAKALEVASSLGVPLMSKYSIASAPISAIVELNSHPACDAICVSNTLPYGWQGIGKREWGREKSPLEKFGGGGLSGRALRPLVCDWIKQARDAGFTKVINGGGGIFSCEDVDAYRQAGASSIFLGTVVPLRPWRVKKIIAYANSLQWRQ